jgi:hypothetical protein
MDVRGQPGIPSVELLCPVRLAQTAKCHVLLTHTAMHHHHDMTTTVSVGRGVYWCGCMNVVVRLLDAFFKAIVFAP